MSVLAVLGILIAQIYIEMIRESLRNSSLKTKWIGRIVHAVSAVCISLAAQIFVLFPMWLVFDELSLVALPCGLILSPFVTAVLFLTPLMLLFSWLPLLPTLIAFSLRLICRSTLDIAAFFSSIEGITVSFGHRFFSVFIPLSALVIALLLILKYKQKWPIPTAVGTVILSLSVFLCFLRMPPTKQLYIDMLRHGENEVLLFSADEQSVICDMTSGAYSSLEPIYDMMTERYATEISSYVLTHYHAAHVRGLSRLFSDVTVHSLCLPRPNNSDESSAFSALLSLAKEHGLTVWIYDRGIPLDFGVLSLTVSNQSYLNRSVHPVFLVAADAFGQSILYASGSAYEDATLYQEICEKTENTQALILGSHGPAAKQIFYCPPCNYIFLNNGSDVSHFVPPKDSTPHIVCDSTKISLCLYKE